MSLFWGQARMSVLFTFFLGPAEAPFNKPETLKVTNGPVFLRPEASALSCSSSSLLLFRSCSILSNSHLKSTFWSNKSLTQLPIFSHSFSACTVFWARWFSLWCSPLNSSTISSAHVVKAVVMAAQTGAPMVAGEEDWPGSRKGIGNKDLSWTWSGISPSWVCPSFSCWGSCTCNPHRTSVTLSTFALSMGVMVYDFKVQLRMSPFRQ